MTLTELKSHKLYDLCTRAQQLFLETYLSNGGHIAEAIRLAFPKVKKLSSYALTLQTTEPVGTLISIIDEEENPTDEAIRKMLYREMRKGGHSLSALTNAASVMKQYSDDKPPSAADIAKARRKAAEELDNGQ